MNRFLHHTLLAVAVFTALIFSCSAFAQEPQKTRQSPLAIVSARYKDTYLKIVYSQPQKKGRKIFGQLVPFGQVWRLGANEATELTCTNDFILAGNTLKAGTYSLFAIPDKDKWTLIVNRDVGLWGSYNYNTTNDLFRVSAPVQRNSTNVVEFFTVRIDQKTDTASLVFLWDETIVIFPLQFIEPKP